MLKGLATSQHRCKVTAIYQIRLGFNIKKSFQRNSPKTIKNVHIFLSMSFCATNIRFSFQKCKKIHKFFSDLNYCIKISKSKHVDHENWNSQRNKEFNNANGKIEELKKKLEEAEALNVNLSLSLEQMQLFMVLFFQPNNLRLSRSKLFPIKNVHK